MLAFWVVRQDRRKGRAGQREIFHLWRPLLPDPSDDLLLELAAAVRCQSITTFKRRDFVGADKFAVSVVEPGPFLAWPWSPGMSTLSVRLPNSFHRQLRELAVREGVSMNQLISSAVGEKLAALMTEDYLVRVKRGSRKAYAAVLRKVRDVPAEKRDTTSNKKGTSGQGAVRSALKR